MARGDIYTAVWDYVTDPKYAVHFLTDPKFTKWLSVALLTIDAVLCALIIKVIPCKYCLSSVERRAKRNYC